MRPCNAEAQAQFGPFGCGLALAGDHSPASLGQTDQRPCSVPGPLPCLASGRSAACGLQGAATGRAVRLPACLPVWDRKFSASVNAARVDLFLNG